ncbi:male-enhanced antigen 1 isoform X2 [Bombina bombina]|uniref:male-enhanced antigen 1 isoform X2 n=1 Tax=Bombina bombina TaxID=8345 RepID=UPI00235A6C51|nr:male-enhanced antigen 1 isoform X2 [Bombina bombina]
MSGCAVELTMGPERVFPNQSEELGDAQEPTGGWSDGEEEEGEDGEIQSGYQYQPLNQDPEEGAQGDIQERLQAMRLHLPDPPADSDDDGEEESDAAHRSILMDAAHVELVKSTMAGIKLSNLSVPHWAQQLSDADWEQLVHQTIESRTSTHSKK